ncbi:GCN5 family acetyltransferase [Hapalosiphon sp. MRB220]|nr:GCN5 family acetyltransferase [Hapalosiphon sp. MRB220]
MKLQRFEYARQFYDRVKYYLLSQEAMHNLLLGIADTLIHHPERYQSQPYLATVEIDRDIIAVAMRTPPYDLVLSQSKNVDAVKAIAKDLHSSSEQISAVNAPTIESETFAQAWCSLTNQSYQLNMAMRAFQLEQVQHISQATGYLRIATESDQEMLRSWFEAFCIEAIGKVESDPQAWINHHLQQQAIYLWQDKVTVSMASRGQFTPHGVRINLVYTPPEYRGKGYASACLAELSQNLLNQGHKYCFLFTDLANSTTNHIYQLIGYRPVGDWHNYRFIS